jgi:Ca2+-binding EF-hand superfamily protein
MTTRFRCMRLGVFTFDIFDTNADGVLDAKQVLTMFNDLSGKDAEENEHIRM